MERRLAAILAADVVGYSRLMGTNEVGTLIALKTHRAELIDNEIAAHQGRIFKLMGDGMLVEFSSVLNALTCAALIQRRMRERNADVPDDRRIEYRIGINLGDVIIEDDDDVFGNGVNIAARVETFARPGGIAISSVVRDNVGDIDEMGFEDAGLQKFKNIRDPVHVYHVDLDPLPEGTCAIASAASVDKPSIAVMPFINMSGDSDQDYFSDGMTEDLITDLSKIARLFVVGRNISFAYKGQATPPQTVARELGVRYLVEGSIRKVGTRVRINCQLVDGVTAGHVWADRYDRELTDIFAIQDEITKTIISQLKIRLLPEEQRAIEAEPTQNMEAYTYYLRGRQFFRVSTKQFLMLARRMFAKAVELDDGYALAYTGIANCDSMLHSWHSVELPVDAILASAEKALALAPDLAEAHAARGSALSRCGREVEAETAFKTAMALNPNSHETNCLYAKFSLAPGHLDRAAQLFIRALELQPDDYFAPLMLQNVFEMLGRRDEGIRYARLGLRRAEEALQQHPECSLPAQLGAAALASLGERERAREWLARALAIDPGDNEVSYNAACTYALLGDVENAIDMLEGLLPRVGVYIRKWFQIDSDLDPIRSHPRYAGLLQLVA